jgi:hypothetical protein
MPQAWIAPKVLDQFRMALLRQLLTEYAELRDVPGPRVDWVSEWKLINLTV